MLDRIERAFIGLALAAAAGPAAASDFRGVFSLFIAAPYLVAAALAAGFILLRRGTASSRGPLRYIPIVPLLIAWVLLAWLCIFASSYVFVAIAMVSTGLLLAARMIWRAPHGRGAAWLARGFIVLSVAAAGIMAWDQYQIIGDGMEPGQGGALFLLGLLFAVSFVLCLFAARRKPTGRRQASDA